MDQRAPWCSAGGRRAPGIPFGNQRWIELGRPEMGLEPTRLSNIQLEANLDELCIRACSAPRRVLHDSTAQMPSILRHGARSRSQPGWKYIGYCATTAESWRGRRSP